MPELTVSTVRFKTFQRARLMALGMPGHRVVNMPDQLNNLSPDRIRVLAREYAGEIVRALVVE